MTCFSCEKEFDNMEASVCPFCGSLINENKNNFYKYLGPQDSLLGYQRSYKLVLLKYVIEKMDSNGQASVNLVISDIREFYTIRKQKGLIADKDVDERIANIENSSDYDIFTVIKNQPYEVLNAKGFLFLNKNMQGDLVFVLNEDIGLNMSEIEKKNIGKFIDEKLKLYYSKIDCNVMATPENLNDCTTQYISTNKENGWYKSLDESNQEEEILISKLYSENVFMLFVEFCERNNLLKISELHNFDFESLNSVKGLGTGKIQKIKERYMSFLSGTYSTKDSHEKVEIYPFASIDKSNYELPIGTLQILGVNRRIVSQLAKRGYINIEDLANKTQTEVLTDVRQRSFDCFVKVVEKLEFNLEEVFELVLYECMEENSYSIFLKRASGYTLQEIADVQGVTREWVRQIAAKFLNLIKPLIVPIVHNVMKRSEKRYITVQEVLDIYDNDDFDKIMVYSIKNCSEFEYLDFADVFIKKNSDTQDTEMELCKLVDEFVGVGIDLYEKLEDLDELLQVHGFEYVGINEFINLLQKNGYRIYGDYASKGRQSYGYLCSKLVGKYFKNGIKLYDGRDLDGLRQLAFENFGDLGLPAGNRALSARLSEFLVLSDRGMVTAEENIHIDISTVEAIKEFIDNSPNSQLFYIEIFTEFEGLLTMTSNVINYNFLHGVLMLYYPKDYSYSRDYLMKNDCISGISISDRIENIINGSDKPVHKNDIKEKLNGFSDSMIFNAIQTKPELIQWEYNYYNSIYNIHIDAEKKLQLKGILDAILNTHDGYCSDNMLYEAVKRNMPDFIEENSITCAANVYYIANYYFSDYYTFRRPHIALHDIFENCNTKTIALQLLHIDDYFSHEDYLKLIKELNWSDVTAGVVFSDIEKDFVRVSKDLYLRNDRFYLSTENIMSIQNQLDELLSSEDIVSLVNLSDWDMFPEIGLEWNEFLLATIVENYDMGYIIVSPQVRDRRYQKGILVKKEFKVASYAELIAKMMIKQGINHVSENHFLAFLIIYGLTVKVIPKELYSSDYIKYINDEFVVCS
ncbi:hypothetical protein [Clostridium sp. YIM B02551]|uniref:hypothetical protein n=1 Tax=Clostridium sp. YIM B02551 TaxID=2910679 RepID=UPI001EEC73E5|nr:hypothetical protein [Clostridium sp. YIM B02551]